MILSKSDGLIILLLSAIGLLILLVNVLGVLQYESDNLDAFISEQTNAPIININRASYSDLISLPGIGPELAKRILSYRMMNGPFESLEKLIEIHGIGPGRLQNIEGLVSLCSGRHC